MHWTEILAIVFLAAVVVGSVVWILWKRHKNESIESCPEEGLHGAELVRLYHKKYGKKRK